LALLVYQLISLLAIDWINRLDLLSLYILCQCFEQLLDLDLDQLRRRTGKKRRRGHDERNLAHQGSQAAFFLGRMRATSAGSCDAGASGGEFGGALQLEESGNLFTSITVDTFLRYSLCSNK
jgi:hypothetical protein